MLYVAGSKQAYKCDCGSNCFTLTNMAGRFRHYICNGCNKTYVGEGDDEQQQHTG